MPSLSLPRVLHVIPSLAPRDGGPSVAAIEMCRSLTAAGVETAIAATDADGSGRLPVVCGGWTTYKDVRTMFFPRQWSDAFKYSRPLARWLGEHVGDYDVVHAHAVFSHAPLAAARACVRGRVPYVIRPLGTLNPLAIESRRTAAKRLLWAVAARNAVRRAAAVHFTTDLERRLVTTEIPMTNDVVVPLGAPEMPAAAGRDLMNFRSQFQLAHRPFVLAIGRLHPIKGLEDLIDAFARVRARMPFDDWRLVIAGDGDAAYREKLKQRAAADTSGIIFTGWLSGTAKTAAIRSAALVAVPSRQESFSFSAVEALACGVPVLLSADVGLASEIQKGGAGWVVERASDALGRTLARVMQDQRGRSRAAAAAAALGVSKFTWRRVADDLVHLYEKIREAPAVPLEPRAARFHANR